MGDRQVISFHTQARMQQRGIRSEAIELLLDYGRERHIHDRGREVVFFDKAARRRWQRRTPRSPSKPPACAAPTPSSAPTAA